MDDKHEDQLKLFITLLRRIDASLLPDLLEFMLYFKKVLSRRALSWRGLFWVLRRDCDSIFLANLINLLGVRKNNLYLYMKCDHGCALTKLRK